MGDGLGGRGGVEGVEGEGDLWLVCIMNLKIEIKNSKRNLRTTTKKIYN